MGHKLLESKSTEFPLTSDANKRKTIPSPFARTTHPNSKFHVLAFDEDVLFHIGHSTATSLTYLGSLAKHASITSESPSWLAKYVIRALASSIVRLLEQETYRF